MKRILSAVILFPIVMAIIVWGNTYVVDAFIGIIALRCIYELFHAFEQKGHKPVRWIGYLAALVIMFIHVIPKEHVLILISAIIPISILILFILVLRKDSKINVIDIAITFFGVCYIVLFLMFMSIIREMENGKFLIWYVFLASWMTDTFAYFIGKKFGKHHFTNISPNKTIEGCVGGTLGAVIAVIIYTIIINLCAKLNINVFIIGIVAILLSLIGQLGDLAASAIKRYTGIKDYSDLIPGHGGMVDRVDSVIFIAPFAYLLFIMIF